MAIFTSTKQFVVAFAFTTTCAAADPPTLGPSNYDDLELERSAYVSLQRDETLRSRNIGIRVLKGGTAILWGQATGAEAARAKTLLLKINGINAVENWCEPDRVVMPNLEDHRAPPSSANGEISSPSSDTVRVSTPARPTIHNREPPRDRFKVDASVAPIDRTSIERIRTSERRFADLRLDLRDGRVTITADVSDSAAAWELARSIAPFVGPREVVVLR